MKYYSIIIGPNGIWLKLSNNQKIIADLFIEKDNFSQQKKNIKEFFQQDKKSNIYIFLDNLTQNYTRKHFPLLNPIDLYRLSNRRFNMETQNTDLRTKFFLGKNKEKKVYEYLFVSASMDEDLIVIFNLLDELPNIIFGIYLIPLESQSLLNLVFKKLKIKKKDKPELVILLFQTRVGGFRQVSFMNEKLLFTRLLSDENGELTKDFKSKFLFFEEDLKKTISFIKRFVPRLDYSKLALITITDENTNTIFKQMNLHSINRYSYTFDNFSTLFFKKYIKNENEFSENFIENITIFKKHIYMFILQQAKYIKNLYNISHCVKYIFYIICIVLFCFFVSFFIVFYQYKTNIKTLNKDLSLVKTKFKREIQNDYLSKSKDPYFIVEIASLHNFYSSNYKYPFEYNNYIQTIFNNTNTIINSINWKLNNFDYINFDSKNSEDSINIKFKLINESGSLDDLLNSYENFKEKINSELKNISYSLQDIEKNKLNFNDKYYIFETNLKITNIEKNDREIIK